MLNGPLRPAWQVASRVALVSAVAVALVAGCASPSGYQSGPLINAANVSKIQKGTTTMGQVEAMFGPPGSITLMGDGRRMAVYWSFSMQATPGPTDPKTFIPLVGPMLATNTAQATRRQQQLQIIYTNDGIVQDYEFTDNTSRTDLSMHGTAIQSQTKPATAGPEPK